MRRALLTVVLSAVFTLACSKGGPDSTEDKLKKLEEQRKQLKDSKAAANAPRVDDTPKDPFWDSASLVTIQEEGKCPDNFWALFGGPAPGATPEEKKANEAKRSEYAKVLRDSQFVIKLRMGNGLDLEEYNAAKGYFPLKAKSTIDCKDSIGNVTVALTDVKAQTPPSSAAKEGAAYTIRIWYAEPQAYEVPMTSMADAKTWKNKSSLGLEGRYIFKLGKTANDKKLEKVARHVEKAGGETIEIGGGTEDWGAGRMIRADVQAMRITTDRGTKTVVEKR